MSFNFSIPLHHLVKSSFHFNFHSPKKPLLAKLHVSSTHIETKIVHSSNGNNKIVKRSEKNEFRRSKDEFFVEKMNNEVKSQVIESKVVHNSNENKRVVKKSGKNDFRSFKDENSVEKMKNEVNYKTNENSHSGLCLSGDANNRVLKKNEENGSRSSKSNIFAKKTSNEASCNKGKVFSSNSSSHRTYEESPSGLRLSSDEKTVLKIIEESGLRKKNENGYRDSDRSFKSEVFVKRMNGEAKKKVKKGEKKSSIESPGIMVRAHLDMCSKRGDVMGALTLYDKVQTEGLKLGQYHYSVFLYLCSSAAIGVVSPAKSGNDGRSLSSGEVPALASIGSNEHVEVSSGDSGNMELNNQLSKNGKFMVNGQVIDGEIRINDDFRKYALKRGFEIYERMRLEKVPMNEASLTSIARMTLAMGDGDMAFDTVKQMKELGINPRLRSYGPALTAFCNSGNIDKAFLVEEHMLEHGVYPEEPELEALLRVSIEASRSDKVYYLLHKLRTRVRQVSASTADLLEKWFQSDAASKVGKRTWDERSIRNAIEKGGGGWHGEGWLDEGKWNALRTSVGDDGLCKCCGEKLATIDLDPVETEKFAESVASIAAKREKSSFQKFQKWVDYYGPFEAVVDAANIGLLTQRKFKPSKVNAVVNGIRHMLPSKKWPLIVLHNRRVTDDSMDTPMNKAIVQKWKNADALYATPTGSNDDWYWLYAAIKCKCLLVTNDEMRDHLFQLLGNDFFPRWKERHQVHFSFSETGPIFHMPPPCSVVIQESKKGHWHIPLASEHEFTDERQWLCVTRNKSEGRLNSTTLHGDIGYNGNIKSRPQENCSNRRSKSETVTSSIYSNILGDIEAAEKLGVCVIDFEI